MTLPRYSGKVLMWLMEDMVSNLSQRYSDTSSVV